MIVSRPWETRGRLVFLAWRPDRDETIDDAREVSAIDAEQAAEDLAEHDDIDGADYTIVNGSPATVAVRPKDDPGVPVETFTVSGQIVHRYTARRSS